MQKILGIDFDQTLAITKYPAILEPITWAIEKAKQCRLNGMLLVLITHREGQSLQDAIDFCKTQGLEFDLVNENHPFYISMWGYDSRKIYSDFFVDDHNLTLQEFSRF